MYKQFGKHQIILCVLYYCEISIFKKMSADQADYDKFVKDYLRLRLTEFGWTSYLINYIKYLIAQGLEAGYPRSSIKFNQLYSNVIKRARLAIPVNMEEEFHQKIGEYLSVNFDEISASLALSRNPGASFLQSSQDLQGISSSTLTNAPSSIPLSTLTIAPSDVVHSSNLTNDHSNISSSVISYDTTNVLLSSPLEDSDIPSLVCCNVIPDINK